MPIANLSERRTYMRTWVSRRRQAWLAGRCCTVCGSTSRLEIDHIDPTDKVDHRIWSWSRPRREAELVKCQVLCRPCHIRKSADAARTPLVHGTNTAYVHKGCRCDACRRAHNERSRFDKQRARLRRAS